MKTPAKFIDSFGIVNEDYSDKLTIDEKIKIEECIIQFNEGKFTIEDFTNHINGKVINEGIGSILGGLTGFALGKTIGQILCKALGIKDGLLYDVLTSRAIGTVIGSIAGGRN